MPTLYEISDDLLKLALLLTDTDGEVPEGEAGEALECWFASVTANMNDKVLAYCHLIANLEANAAACDDELERIAKLRDSNRNAAKRLKNRLKAFFELHGIKRLDLGTFRPHIRANGGEAPLIVPAAWERDPAQAPEVAQRRVIELDKHNIRLNLEAGEVIDGCAIGERGTHFRLR